VGELLEPELRGPFSLFKRSLVGGSVDVGVGTGRPVVAGTLAELERREAMGGGDSGCKAVGDKGGFGHA
jgi:hypothetical protein